MKKLVHDYMNGNKIANETFEERFAVYTSGKNGKFVELVKSNEVKQFAVDYAAKMKVNLNIFKLVGKVRQKEVHVIEPVFEEIV